MEKTSNYRSRFLQSNLAKREVFEEGLKEGKIEKPPTPDSAKKLNLEYRPDKGNGEGAWVGRCPACAADGNDKTGEHLLILPNGKWACVVYQGAAGIDHRSAMAKLSPQLRGKGKVIPRHKRAPNVDKEKLAIVKASQALFTTYQSAYSGEVSLLGDSVTIKQNPLWHFNYWLDNMFSRDDLVWIGHLKDYDFASHTFLVGDLVARKKMYQTAITQSLDLTRGLSWANGSTSRHGKNIKEIRYMVLEHDDVPKPAQVALLHYAKNILNWDLRMVLDTRPLPSCSYTKRKTTSRCQNARSNGLRL